MMSLELALSLARQHSLPDPNTGCWMWRGALTSAGYARVRHEGRAILLSRALLGLPGVGSTRAGSPQALHRCDTPACVNPDHLFRGTPLDNRRDSSQKGRHRNQNTLASHCKHGHEFTPENTRCCPKPDGTVQRKCRICLNARKAAYRERHPEKYRAGYAARNKRARTRRAQS